MTWLRWPLLALCVLLTLVYLVAVVLPVLPPWAVVVAFVLWLLLLRRRLRPPSRLPRSERFTDASE